MNYISHSDSHIIVENEAHAKELILQKIQETGLRQWTYSEGEWQVQIKRLAGWQPTGQTFEHYDQAQRYVKENPGFALRIVWHGIRITAEELFKDIT